MRPRSMSTWPILRLPPPPPRRAPLGRLGVVVIVVVPTPPTRPVVVVIVVIVVVVLELVELVLLLYDAPLVLRHASGQFGRLARPQQRLLLLHQLVTPQL